MTIADLVRRLAEAGATPEVIAIAIEAVEAQSTRLAEIREAAKERKRKSREKRQAEPKETLQKDMSRDGHVTVTGQSRDGHVTTLPPPCSPPLPLSLPPTPPNSFPFSPPIIPPSPQNSFGENSKTRRKSSERGSRLPENWTLPEDWASEAYQYRTPNGEYLTAEEISHEADKFRDHWIAQGGSRGVKVDWRATWRNWIRNGSGQIIRNRNASRNGRSGSGGQHERPSLAAAFMRAGGLLEDPDDVPRGPQNGRLDLEGRFHRGEVVPFGGAARPARG